MPWDSIKLNDGALVILGLGAAAYILCTGTQIPSIGFGTWTLGNGQNVIDQVDQAISLGFSHVGEFLCN